MNVNIYMRESSSRVTKRPYRYSRCSSARNGKKESQRRGGEVKKAIPFLVRGERGGETGKLDSGPELERLAQFTSNATTAILAAITAPVPTGPTLVTPLFTHLRVPLLARHISQETGGWLLYPSMRTTIGLDLQKE